MHNAPQICSEGVQVESEWVGGEDLDLELEQRHYFDSSDSEAP